MSTINGNHYLDNIGVPYRYKALFFKKTSSDDAKQNCLHVLKLLDQNNEFHRLGKTKVSIFSSLKLFLKQS